MKKIGIVMGSASDLPIVKKAIDMLTKAQTASKTLQQNAINSVNKLMNDTELHYSRALQEMKVMKSRMEGKATASANKQK